MTNYRPGVERGMSTKEWEKYAPEAWTKAYVAALKILRDPRLAEEVAQEATLASWQRRKHLVSGQNFNGYAYKCGQNRARDIGERQRRVVTQSLDSLPLRIRKSMLSDGPDKTYSEVRALALVGTLPEIDQPAARLILIEGYSQREATNVLGEPLGTVKTRDRRNRRQLREEIQAERS